MQLSTSTLTNGITPRLAACVAAAVIWLPQPVDATLPCPGATQQYSLTLLSVTVDGKAVGDSVASQVPKELIAEGALDGLILRTLTPKRTVGGRMNLKRLAR